MNEFLKGVTGTSRVQNLVLAWLAPLTLGYFVAVVFVLPSIRESALISRLRVATVALSVNSFVFSLVLLLCVAACLSMAKKSLYSVLEGESWPRRLRRWRVNSVWVPYRAFLIAELQVERSKAALESAKAVLTAEGECASEAHREQAQRYEQNLRRWTEILTERKILLRRRGRSTGILAGLPRRTRPLLVPRVRLDGLAEGLTWLPDEEISLLPTRFGNAMKQAESWSATHYDLDSQTLWYELISVAPEALRADIDNARQVTDTLVCAVYVSLGLAMSALGSAYWVSQRDANGNGLLVVAFASFVAAGIAYRSGVASIADWRDAVQALVNNGRNPVREKFGLRAPASTVEEKAMWRAVTGYVAYGGGSPYEEALDSFRQPTSETRSTG